ncbi:MAG: glycosyltransferase [Capsulimonadales bacterium]|nr:glycosyltransferase [Capsulimonadales bacterium]
MSMLLSVIIPTFRRPALLAEAIRSVLDETGPDTEIIVMDDSPEGSARDVAEGFGEARVRYCMNPTPSGGRPAAVRNLAYRHATGRYLHFLDDDDRIATGAYQAMIDALEKNPDAGVAYGWVVPFGNNPKICAEKTDYFTRAAQIASKSSRLRTVALILFRGALMVNSACMIRRELFETLGGYDPEIAYYEDVEFWMRAIRRYGHVYVNRPILNYRVGSSSLMHDLQEDWVPVMESYRIIHRKYKERHGMAEYALLKLFSLTLPSVIPVKA